MLTMRSLDELLESRPELTLDELVETANDLLGRYLPKNVEDARIKEEVNPRLVRHYTTEEMLDSPIPKGRERRYTVDHLLQLLALRRLLAEGLSASQVGRSLRETTRTELRRIVEGDRSMAAPPKSTNAASALAAIESIRRRTAGSVQSGGAPLQMSFMRSAAGSLASSPPSLESTSETRTADVPTGITWERFQLMDGVELSVRSDVSTPSTPEAQERLLDEITRLLIQIGQRRMK